MDKNIFKYLVNKIKDLKEENSFYREKYKNFNPDEICGYEDFKKIVPLLCKGEIFAVNNLDRVLSFDDGVIFPSAGTTNDSDFSFRYSLNNYDKKNFNDKLIALFDLWFNVRKKKTMIINAYPLGVILPEGPYTVINAGVRDDIIIYTLGIFSRKFEQVVIIAQPHFLKHLIDLPQFDRLNINKSNIYFVLGGAWFPYTLEIYILKKLHGDMWRDFLNNVKSTYGTAENGLGILLDFTVNLRKHFFKNKLDEIIPLVYQYDPSRFFVEDVDGELIITNLEKSNPELIRYNTEDKVNIPANDDLPKEIKKYAVNNVVYLFGRGHNYQTKARIMHNLFFDPVYAAMITGNFYLDEDQTLFLQLSRESSAINKAINYFMSIFDFNVKMIEYDKYRFIAAMDRKPVL
ncbi:MAG: hypothetical protein Athens101410_741 [Parcubacteria group bacterium Athens1014_10]|nr:MAG: hypothetical protein Athens101410_741 [Parcubacteria group bacterium Athens1014_10]TSD04494.1 MAG: hypothetical protein Athens071412_758 [Parcubacteria group bacterium Athens0714_12]